MYNVLEYRNCPIVRTNGFHTFVHCITQFNYAARVLSIPANGKRKGVVLTLDQKLKMIALRKAGTARAVLMIMLGFKLEYTMAVLKEKFAEVEKDGTELIDQLPLAREMGFVDSMLQSCIVTHGCTSTYLTGLLSESMLVYASANIRSTTDKL